MKNETFSQQRQQVIFSLAKNYEHGARPVRSSFLGTGASHERIAASQEESASPKRNQPRA